MSSEFLNQSSQPGSSNSSIPQSNLEWDNYLQTLDDPQQQQQQQAGPSSSAMSNYMDVTNNVNLDMSIDSQTNPSLLQNSFLPNLPSSSSTLPPISTFKNFPALLSPSLQNPVKEPKSDGRLMSAAQLETRKKEVREKAKKQRMKDKLMQTSTPNVENGSAGNESSFAQADATLPGLSDTSPTSRLEGRSQSLPDDQKGKPVQVKSKNRVSTQSADTKIKRPSDKVRDQTVSMDEKERMKKERMKEWRRNNYLKKKKLEEEKLMNEMASMDEETRMLHQKKLEKCRLDYAKRKERQKEGEKNQKEEAMNNVDSNTESTSAVNEDIDASRVEGDDRNTSNFESSSILQEPDVADPILPPSLSQSGELDLVQLKLMRKKEKLSQYRKTYYERKKKRISEEIEQRRQLILQDMQREASGDYTLFNETNPPMSSTDYSIYQPGEGKKKKKSWGVDDENRKKGKKFKMNYDGYKRMDDELRQNKRWRSKEMTLGDVYHDYQMDGDDQFYDAQMTMDDDGPKFIPAADVQPKEKVVEEIPPPKLYQCTSCEFSSPNSFSLLIHTKIHETVNMLPQFLRNLLSVNDNLKRLLTDDEPDVSRASKYFAAAGLSTAAGDESSKNGMV